MALETYTTVEFAATYHLAVKQLENLNKRIKACPPDHGGSHALR
jgi:hypothetical protein